MLPHYLVTLCALIAATASAPILSTSPGLATVDLRITGPESNHYTAPDQAPTSDHSQHLTIVVGQTLALERDPLHVQGLQIASVTAGESLSLLPQSIQEDDWRVKCSARMEGREDVVEFDMKDKGVLLAGGRLVTITRLNCSVDAE